MFSLAPNIEKDLFPGKPFKTKSDQDGFVVKKPPENNKEKVVQVKMKADLTDSTIK